MILLGLLIGTVGMDQLTGTMRFTHGVKELYDGIGFIPVAMGVFGIGEILSSTEESLVRQAHKIRFRELLPSREEIRASWGPIFRGTGLGFLIGLLPGSAHVLASFLSYTLEKRLSNKPEEFGTGRIEGVAGPETANNAATGGAMIPFLALGIPTGPAAPRSRCTAALSDCRACTWLSRRRPASPAASRQPAARQAAPFSCCCGGCRCWWR